MTLLFISHVDDPKEWQTELRRLLPGLKMRVGPQTRNLDDIDLALVWAPPPGELRRYPNLKAILSLGAGVDHILKDPRLPKGVPIARLVDPMLTELMSEYVLLSVLRHHREFDHFEAMQRKKKWDYRFPPDRSKRRVGVMGMGVLGTDAARKLVAAGFPVLGWSRRQKRIPGVESYSGTAGLGAFLKRTDILVCLLPLTGATRDLIDAKFLKRMPKGAYFVNPSRGAVVVEKDLIGVLDSGHLAGATLDVFREEPLPKSHPFWTHPKVLVTPHVAAMGYPYSAAPRVALNIRRARAGKRMLDLIDPKTGY
ncbi:MAG: glyoxylate/hydroxypyruvate reductase A [Rhodospirillales bacterium]|nr:glyoxylate/hydroxypyruvate reductase A [Rhodospirillales bacterium]